MPRISQGLITFFLFLVIHCFGVFFPWPLTFTSDNGTYQSAWNLTEYWRPQPCSWLFHWEQLQNWPVWQSGGSFGTRQLHQYLLLSGDPEKPTSPQTSPSVFSYSCFSFPNPQCPEFQNQFLSNVLFSFFGWDIPFSGQSNKVTNIPMSTSFIRSFKARRGQDSPNIGVGVSCRPREGVRGSFQKAQKSGYFPTLQQLKLYFF